MTIILNPLELEELIRERLDKFYQQRVKKLTELKLNEVLSTKNAYPLRVVGVQRALEIVTEILCAYMTSFDEAFWEELTGDPEFYIKLINLMRDYPVQHRIEFEKEWDKALNRFEHDFLNNFGNSDGSIDWEKLLRFNSGKDKVTWISKVVPAIGQDYQDDTGDEMEDAETDQE